MEQHHLKVFLLFLPLVISCGDPGPVANGIYLGSEFTFNHTVTYRCNSGHLMEPLRAGRNVLRCTKDGSWNQTKPSCKGMRNKCLFPWYDFTKPLTFKLNNRSVQCRLLTTVLYINLHCTTVDPVCDTFHQPPAIWALCTERHLWQGMVQKICFIAHLCLHYLKISTILRN